MPIDRNSPQQSGTRTIVYGVFKGMGDLLCAAPVVRFELDHGHTVKLLLFPGATLSDFVELIDFGPNRHNLHSYQLPVGAPARFLAFLRQMASFRADLVWISPHASRKASSWKIPLLLWLVKNLFWRRATMAGAWDERFSGLFDLKVPLDRTLSLAVREWTAYSQLNPSMPRNCPGFTTFIERIRPQPGSRPAYDLLIAPGANAQNRVWPVENYRSLIEMIPPGYKIAVVGLPDDIEKLQRSLPVDRQIQFISGTLEDAIRAIARARVVLSMDSGNMHFANALHVPGIALFGKADPKNIIPGDGSMSAFYEKKFPCQPCESASCSQPELYCMKSIFPQEVAKSLTQLLRKVPVDIGAAEISAGS
jgi:heptosyltransferase-2